MPDKHNVTLQFPAVEGMSSVVTVLSEGVGQRFGLTDTAAERLASAVDEAVHLFIGSPQLPNGDVTRTAAESKPSFIQVTFISTNAGVQADVARQGLGFKSSTEATEAHQWISQRLGDSITSIVGPTIEGVCSLYMNR